MNSETKYLEIYRTRKVLSIGFLFLDEFIWTGKFFKFVYIKEQKYKQRYLEFDSGWNYTWYWSKWYYDWKFIEIEK